MSVRNSARVGFLLLSLVLIGSVFLPLPDAAGRIAHLPSLCPFYNLTGLPCPGCGLTRAFVCLGHGRVLQSLHWHPLGWLVYALCTALWLRTGLTWLRGRELGAFSRLRSGRFAWAGLAGLLLADVARIGWLTAHHLTYH